ncbi:glycine/D-amino acid oxidase-like deaminating enzyme [Mesorhizobium soli]|jgi:glycine/D-amino acid oxidase-like deaminating enzyme|uniref:NAD(P)/FAD-dependent oxidoreductase n=1 Tax=Pseudaminobacter soli (ex Li et al. 2025) TaxID=1295366 RepID=UPI002475F326|nr:FAD-binding oxidoreductase [Mesorhizobium soli]MDH6230836.1 glycine/D-amino acid oxidase-like deaminating enzyme [Mesorhizobium soli]
MGPVVDPVPTRDTRPEAADVVIVGGGIIGVSAALFLARSGVSVVLCEKGYIAGEQSSRNWGWVRRMGRDPRELALIVEALKLWPQMEELVGEDVGFRRTGILYLCEDDSDIAHHEDWLKSAGSYALDTHLIEGKTLSALMPGATRNFRAALYTPSDGRAEPQKAAPAIARAAQRAGARILAPCAVRSIETEGGRISGVVTEQGVIRTSTVIVAGGAWSSRLCGSLGLRLPQLTVRASVMRTGPVEGGPDGAAWGKDFAYRKRLDGGYTLADGTLNFHHISPNSFRYFRDFLPMLSQEWRMVRLRAGTDFFTGPFGLTPSVEPGKSVYERHRTLDPEPVTARLEVVRKKMEEMFPVLKGVPIEQRWAGFIDATPDAVPVISPVKSLPGLVIATGFSGHGFGIGPAAGQLAANLVTGDTPIVDPTPFRYERFIDGTRPRPTTGV